MAMVVEGQSNKEIARILNLREVTIKVQLTHIYKKLGAKNRAQAAMLISRDHLLD
jgi:two-component system, NarL family, nitrate/nitrite response regulator NarL